MNYYLHIAVLLEIYILLALSANQMIGNSGLLNLSHAVFYGLGAYVTAILTTQYGFGYFQTWVLLFPSIIIISILYSYIGSKVRELYFSLASLTVQVIFSSLLLNLTQLTKGPYGIPGISHPEIAGYSINNPLSFAILGLSIIALCILGLFLLSKRKFYLLIQATRDDEIGLLNLGYNPNKYRFLSISVSGLLASIAGSIYASYMTFIDPSSFTLDESILILSIVLIGGIGSFRGAIIGAAIYVLLPEILNDLHLPQDYAANLRMVLFGLLLIFIVRFRPQGILGKKYVT